MKIYYSSAPSGAGKTYSIRGRARKISNDGCNVLLIQPTIQLIEQTCADFALETPHLHVEVFHEARCNKAGNRKQSVQKAIHAYLRKPYPEPHVLIITWASFERLAYFHRPQDWHVLIDETPQAHDHKLISAPLSHSTITGSIETVMQGPTYSQIIVQDRYALRRVAENEGRDAAIQPFSELAGRLISGKWKAYVHEAQYRRLLTGKARNLSVFLVLSAKIFKAFKSITIAGARFEETLLYQLWSIEGVEFQRDQDFEENLRYQEHSGGERLQIHFGYEGDWTKSFLNRDNRKALVALINAAKELFGSEDFLWMGNNDVPSKLIGAREESHRLSGAPFGLNGLQHHSNMLILSALNPRSEHYRFLEWKGIDAATVKTATYRHSVYQAVMRCSIRNPGCNKPVCIVVPDKVTAEWLSAIFQGSTVQNLGLDEICGFKGQPGRPRKHKTDAERRRVHREQTRNKLLQEMSHLNPVGSSSSQNEFGFHNECDENPLNKIGLDFVSRFHGSLWHRPNSIECFHTIHSLSQSAFIELLKQTHKREHLPKSKNGLLSPSYFQAVEGVKTHRGMENVLFSRGIWLDFEGGNLTHKGFANLLPRLRIVAFNTSSSTADDPRWRAYIPTSGIMTADVYQHVTGQIVRHVIESGWRLTKRDPAKPDLVAHGIDLSKLKASDLFFLPCQARDKKASFFKDYKGSLREPLIVEDWINYSILNEQLSNGIVLRTDVGPELTEEQKILLNNHLHRWQTVGTLPGRGDHELSRLAIGLFQMGVTRDLFENFLLHAAQGAHSPGDRVKQVKRIVNLYFK